MWGDDSSEKVRCWIAATTLVLGSLSLVGGVLGAFWGSSLDVVVRSSGIAALGGLLFPTAHLLFRDKALGRWLGVVAFGGLAALLAPPLFSGLVSLVSLLGTIVTGICSLYLLFAGGSFGRDHSQYLREDADPDDPIF